MKRRILAAVIGLGLLSIAGSAMAQGLATIAVSAQIPAKCAVDSVVGQTADFGDVITTPATPKTVTTLFRCTKGTAITITDDGGLHGGTPGISGNVNAGGVDNINYTYAYTVPNGGVGAGWGGAQQLSMAIVLTLNQTQADAATVGNYTDTLGFTITP
ncbi:MAG: spore coat protein U domain-containing protein [Deltaproteobacteria bacterium]|nr:spore coat protein U domain-containing protein [Deltaproteobacteria bacterium]